MHALIYVRFMHSYVLLFLCLLFIVAKCSCWHCSVIEIRSLVLARDDSVGSLCCCFVDVHIFKTEEHKNKRGH